MIIHLTGKLPLVADLRQMPTPSDQGVLCTNVRTRDGKRPSFIDDGKAWFLIPMHEVTIIELPTASLEAIAESETNGLWQVDPDGLASPGRPDDELETSPVEPDEELLARIRQL